MRASIILSAVLGLSFLLPARAALAHGREPALGHVIFHPADPDSVVVRATWGFVTTRDGGETWTWQAADAVPFDRMREDPSMACFPSGSLIAATFDGLRRSDEAQCSWSSPSGAPTNEYVTDVILDPADLSSAWAIASPGATPDRLYRSEDDGHTWSEVATPHATALTDRIRIAPSDPMRVYTSGVVPRTEAAPRIGMVLRSDDRGATFRAIPIELAEDERTVHLLGIDPTNADRVFARAVRRVADETPERLLLSEDGGETWSTVLELLEIVGFEVSEDGRTAWAGSWDGGLYRSTDGGLTFAALDPALRVRCLAYRPGELWVCADDFVEDFALARSTDDGDTLVPLWAYEDVVNDVGCPPGTPVGDLTPMYWPDLQFDLRLVDGGVPEADAGTSADAGDGSAGGESCSCVAVGASRARAPWLALVLVVPLAVRARRWLGRI